MTIFNIVLFGETGAGKSSILNMLAGRHVVDISGGATGCTFQNQACDVNLSGKTFRIHDTAGLDEGEAGRVPASAAIVQLYKLVKSLDDGVSLLVFCMRAPRLKDAAHKNWKLFHEVICQGRVPIAVAITGLEQEENMDNWWHRNQGAFHRYKMYPSGFACLTATRGKKNRDGTHKFDEEYALSREKMSQMIQNHHLHSPWRVGSIEWFRDIVTVTYESRACRSPIEHRETRRVMGQGVQQLINQCDLTHDEAKELGEKLAWA